MAHITRKEIKQPDTFQTYAARAFEWLQARAKGLMTGAAVVLALAALIVGYRFWTERVAREASLAFALAESAGKNGKGAEMEESLRKTALAFPKTRGGGSGPPSSGRSPERARGTPSRRSGIPDPPGQRGGPSGRPRAGPAGPGREPGRPGKMPRGGAPLARDSREGDHFPARKLVSRHSLLPRKGRKASRGIANP